VNERQLNILDEVLEYPHPGKELRRRIRLKVKEFEPILSTERGYRNREKWRRGMSRCERCQAKLTAILERGYPLKKIERILQEKHPHIQDIRRYTKNVIREVTGYGIFDDYIIEHNLWYVRHPIRAPPEIRDLLRALWDFNRIAGETQIKDDRKVLRAITSRTRTGYLVRAAVERTGIDLEEAAP